MLFMQLAGWEAQGDSQFMLVLFALRCIVSIGYIYLCRTKSIRFTSLQFENVQEDSPTPQSQEPAFTLEDVRTVVIEVMSQMKDSNAQLIECKEQLQLPENAVSTGKRQKGTEERSESFPKNFYRVQAFLADDPDAKTREVATALDISIPTASKWMQKVRAQK